MTVRVNNRITVQNDETIFRCPARAMRDRPQPGNEAFVTCDITNPGFLSDVSCAEMNF